MTRYLFKAVGALTPWEHSSRGRIDVSGGHACVQTEKCEDAEIKFLNWT